MCHPIIMIKVVPQGGLEPPRTLLPIGFSY